MLHRKLRGVHLRKQHHLVIPAGTKVLIRSTGQVGIVTHTPADPQHAYRVRFAAGGEEAFHRPDLTIFKQAHTASLDPHAMGSLHQYVVYRCVVGSTAYGLNHEGSDIDRRGFYLPPADLHWSLAGLPEQLETADEEVYWELEKFIRLALKANPNILECLYTPLVEHCEPIAQDLLAMREMFLSRYVHTTYNSYVLSQFKKIEQDLRTQGEIRWKHVMHLIRLLLSGVTVLREGFVPLNVGHHRDTLLQIRAGQVSWEEVERWRLALHRDLDDALAGTHLPEHPDFDRADRFLIQARRYAASPEYHP